MKSNKKDKSIRDVVLFKINDIPATLQLVLAGVAFIFIASLIFAGVYASGEINVVHHTALYDAAWELQKAATAYACIGMVVAVYVGYTEEVYTEWDHPYGMNFYEWFIRVTEKL